MDDINICRLATFLKIVLVKTPIMGQVCANQNYITTFKPTDMITNKLCAFTLLKVNEF
ncbi:hypothetical protein D3C85_1761670 [compost metagenome]